MQPEGKSWRDLYEFDTPVVGLLSPLLDLNLT